MLAGIFKVVMMKYAYNEQTNPSIFGITSSDSFLNKNLQTQKSNFLAYLTKLLWVISKQIAYIVL